MRWLIIYLCFIATGFPLSTAKAEKNYLTNRYETLSSEHRGLIDELWQSLREKHGKGIIEWVHSLNVGTADLNNDGVVEVLVTPSSTFFCGNSPGCNVSIYQHTDGQWHYIGRTYSTNIAGNLGLDDFSIIENEYINGWRVLTAGENYDWKGRHFCWVDSTSVDPEFRETIADPLGLPLAPGQAGFFGSSPLGEPCPKNW